MSLGTSLEQARGQAILHVVLMRTRRWSLTGDRLTRTPSLPPDIPSHPKHDQPAGGDHAEDQAFASIPPRTGGGEPHAGRAACHWGASAVQPRASMHRRYSVMDCRVTSVLAPTIIGLSLAPHDIRGSCTQA
jgi:hypothetical protein